ncbi:hypothetical protein A1O1_05019 [Capronia coronata CBS 617.96]|uniref:Uncharacterized protein n=1 Tax=Capronia coronata CBS 617.96 TaxID=1182541 RepID=W9YFQ5_9EURO|nr:uncharacterized protein A1O1_05019 [Capronia coronata CBS 617.96]EXJ88091.1 hypothetical protein A1O1_05019 [Capronia coronata CBS 617.96]
MEGTDIESRETRRQRRMAAGRSGGVFEIVQDGNQFSYRYASPVRPYQQGSNVAWESVESVASSTTTEYQSNRVCAESCGPEETSALSAEETKSLNRTSPEMESALSLPSTKTSRDGTELDEEGAPRTKSRRGLRTLKKIDRFVTRFVHRKGITSVNKDDQAKIVGETVEPPTPKPQILEPTSRSPVKEQLELESDRDPGQEELNKEFFTPPRAIKTEAGGDLEEFPDPDVCG